MRLEEGGGAWSRHHVDGRPGGNFSTRNDDWFLCGGGGEDFQSAGPVLTQDARGGQEWGGEAGHRGGLETRQGGGGGGGDGRRRVGGGGYYGDWKSVADNSLMNSSWEDGGGGVCRGRRNMIGQRHMITSQSGVNKQVELKLDVLLM